MPPYCQPPPSIAALGVRVVMCQNPLMRSFVPILRLMGWAFRRAARMGLREYLVSRQGTWRVRWGRCAICGAAHPSHAFRTYDVIGPEMPVVLNREHALLPCGHTVLQHRCAVQSGL